MSEETKKADVIYLTIPGEYTEVYYKLLYLLAAIGKDIISDCNYSCHNNGHNVFTCWNVFQSAISAYNLGNSKEANLLIEYVNGQLDIYANNENIKVPDISLTLNELVKSIYPRTIMSEDDLNKLIENGGPFEEGMDYIASEDNS